VVIHIKPHLTSSLKKRGSTCILINNWKSEEWGVFLPSKYGSVIISPLYKYICQDPHHLVIVLRNLCFQTLSALKSISINWTLGEKLRTGVKQCSGCEDISSRNGTNKCSFISPTTSVDICSLSNQKLYDLDISNIGPGL